MTQPDLTTLNNLYAGCRAYHGEMHDHSASGGTSDGQVPLDEWVKELAELNMDFAGLVYIIPSASNYVGGDIVSGLLALDIHKKQEHH